MNKEVNINKLNYESFVIDYLDGNLSAIETVRFMTFLENNLDVKEDIDGLDKVIITTDKKIFADKFSLKKDPVISVGIIGEDNYEDFFIASYEGDLSKEQELTLHDFLKKNKRLNDEFLLYGKLQIQPDDVVFVHKKSLKHSSSISIVRYLSVAATIIIFLVSWFFLGNHSQDLRAKTAMSQLDSHNSNMRLSPNILVKIETANRQVVNIKYLKDAPELNNIDIVDSHKTIYISSLKSKSISEQLTDSYIYTRLIEQPESIIANSSEIFDSELAFVEPNDEDKRKGLIARVFNSQISKITQGFKSNRTNRSKLNDPAYVKVIDGGLLVFNTLTGTETSTVKTYNQEGELTAYQIEGRDVLLNGNFGDRSLQ